MALFRGIQEYIARDANNIARVEYYIIIAPSPVESDYLTGGCKLYWYVWMMMKRHTTNAELCFRNVSSYSV